MSVRVMPKPERPRFEGAAGSAPDTRNALNFPGSRLYGGAEVNGVRYWYHPPSDLLVRADMWDEIVGDPDAPEPASESFVD